MGALYIDVGKIATYCCVLSGLISKGMNCHISVRDMICFYLHFILYELLRILKVLSSPRNSETHISNSQLRFIPLGLISSIGTVMVASGRCKGLEPGRFFVTDRVRLVIQLRGSFPGHISSVFLYLFHLQCTLYNLL